MPWLFRRELDLLLKQTEYWRLRSESLEAQLAEERKRHSEELSAQQKDHSEKFSAQCKDRSEELRAERERNRRREELLVDRVLTTKGTYAITEKTKPENSQPAEPKLNAIEEAELEMYEQSAVENGYGRAVGRRMWEAKRRGESFEYPSPTGPLDWPNFSETDQIEN